MSLNGWVDLVDAAKLLAVKAGTLRVWLSRYKGEYPPQYRRGKHRKKIRVLTYTEIYLIKQHREAGHGKPFRIGQ